MDSPSADAELSTHSWGEMRRRTVTWYDPMLTAARAASLSGLDFLQAVSRGELAPPPMASLLGFAIVGVEPGKVTFTCDPDESTYNTLGAVHGGLVCTLLDSVAGCAVHTTLPQGVGYASIEIKVNYLKPVLASSGTLTATGTVRKPGRRVAFAEGSVEDADGVTLATTSSTLLVFPMSDGTGATPG